MEKLLSKHLVRFLVGHTSYIMALFTVIILLVYPIFSWQLTEFAKSEVEQIAYGVQTIVEYDIDEFIHLSMLELASEYPLDNELYSKHVRHLTFVHEIYGNVQTYSFIADTESSVKFIGSSGALDGDGAPFGYIYESDKGYLTKAASGEAFLHPEVPYTDDWGTWITYYVPLYDEGYVVGAIGVDYDMERLADLRIGLFIGILTPILLIYVLLGCMFVGVRLYIKYWSNQHANRNT
jgi:hypothetical protein